MFGFQRIHDLAWAAGDSQAKGFLIGATSGRTTLNGEGLQHQDGHSHILSATIPNCVSYDPTFAYEVATIIKDGIENMYIKNKNIFYYITTTNENYKHPSKPKNCDDGIVKGMYKLYSSNKSKIRLLGSGSILRESIKASKILEKYGIESEIWSVTSFNLLKKDGMEVERENFLNPGKKGKTSYVEECFNDNNIPVIAATDYIRSYADQIRPYVNSSYYVLGTDGYGRSDSRQRLREFFEVDAKSIVRTAVYALLQDGEITKELCTKVYKDMKINPNKPNPWEV
jgi:pyruvate dehydrogenase E1 component